MVADLVGLLVAFFVVEVSFAAPGINQLGEWLLVVGSLPGWIVIAKVYGLYDQDEERTHHATSDDLIGVFHLVTIGMWMFFAGAWVSGVEHPFIAKVITLWACAIVFITVTRTLARSVCRRSPIYLQNTVIVGAGDIGHRVARKLLQHPEYGIRLVGLVDADPRPRPEALAHLPLLGEPSELPDIIRRSDVERVVIAFSHESAEAIVATIRSMSDLAVQIDIVPRLFELVGPNVKLDTIEGLPMLRLPAARPARSSRAIKRTLDIVGAGAGLILTAPLLAYITIRVRLDSPGPVLFRQTRLGINMREFTALKFRTMVVGVDTSEHRAYIERTMDPAAAPTAGGLFKLEGGAAVTPFGRWLRKTSLDELPQLFNVLRGDMSLVGPRPCIPYETTFFRPYHFERFLVPAGITGLWQVTARAHATFGEALDMDVAYARDWSLALDLRLLCRTPREVLSGRGTT